MRCNDPRCSSRSATSNGKIYEKRSILVKNSVYLSPFLATVFSLICNYLGKLIPAIQSRCTRFRFAPLSKDQMMPRINHVVEEEGINIDQGGMELLLKLAEGDMRRKWFQITPFLSFFKEKVFETVEIEA